jgi:hypothetical protein
LLTNHDYKENPMRIFPTLGILAMTAACGQFVTAQPPERRDGPPPERRDGLRDALDTNGDHELDADEIKNAAASLAKADRNGNGKIDHEEFRPPLPPIPRGEGGFRGPPPPDRESEGGPPREAGGEPRRAREGRPLRDGAVRGEARPPAEGGPSPERFVERAMTFDADGDGKLDRAEMEKFAVEAMQRLRSGMAARGMGPAAERGEGFRPADGPRRRPEAGEGGERPERPRRPE